MEAHKTRQLAKTTRTTTSTSRMRHSLKLLTSSASSLKSLFSLRRQLNVKWMLSTLSSAATFQAKRVARFRSKKQSFLANLAHSTAFQLATSNLSMCPTSDSNSWSTTISITPQIWCPFVLWEITQSICLKSLPLSIFQPFKTKTWLWKTSLMKSLCSTRLLLVIWWRLYQSKTCASWR